ncbi:chemotaxis protein CheW [Marinobacterium sp. YM272]|uniref:chemotaxis protein CheW n=1 Tax=Marinobacterium sp. YM272 TaxID=3421654 RepID=UPI003D7FFD19
MTTGKNTASSSPSGQAENGQFLTFMSGQELFAVEIICVKEIIEVTQMTHVPKAPVFIRGVINLRGGVVPVIDLGAKLSGQPSELSKRSCVVLVSVFSDQGQQILGLMVDEVREIVGVQPDDIKPPPELGDAADTGFIRAMAQVGESFIVLLNPDQVLTEHEVSQAGKLAENELEAD